MASVTSYISKDGTKSYKVRIRVKCQPTVTKSFSKKAAADRFARDTESSLRDGAAGSAATAHKKRVADAIDRWLDDRLGELSAQEQHDRRQKLDWWRTNYGGYTLSAFSAPVLADAKATLLKTKVSRPGTNDGRTLSAATVTKYLSAISTVLQHAVGELHWVSVNAARQIKPPRVNNARSRFLSEDTPATDGTVVPGELTRLLDACRVSESPDLYPAVLLALTTGARQAETMSLTWDAVDLDAGSVTFMHTKNGDRRTVSLPPAVVDLLKTRPRGVGAALVFPGKPKVDDDGHVHVDPIDLRSAFRTALRRARVVDFKWHDLRHSAASYLAMSGVPLHDIAAVLGHRTLAMTQRYAHLSSEHVARASVALGDRVLGKAK